MNSFSSVQEAAQRSTNEEDDMSIMAEVASVDPAQRTPYPSNAPFSYADTVVSTEQIQILQNLSGWLQSNSTNNNNNNGAVVVVDDLPASGGERESVEVHDGSLSPSSRGASVAVNASSPHESIAVRDADEKLPVFKTPVVVVDEDAADAPIITTSGSKSSKAWADKDIVVLAEAIEKFGSNWADVAKYANGKKNIATTSVEVEKFFHDYVSFLPQLARAMEKHLANQMEAEPPSKKNKHDEEGDAVVDGDDVIEEYYEVEAVIDERVEDGVVQYKVLWKGWDASAASWLNEEDCSSCHELVTQWKKTKREREEAAKKSTKQAKTTTTSGNKKSKTDAPPVEQESPDIRRKLADEFIAPNPPPKTPRNSQTSPKVSQVASQDVEDPPVLEVPLRFRRLSGGPPPPPPPAAPPVPSPPPAPLARTSSSKSSLSSKLAMKVLGSKLT